MLTWLSDSFVTNVSNAANNTNLPRRDKIFVKFCVGQTDVGPGNASRQDAKTAKAFNLLLSLRLCVSLSVSIMLLTTTIFVKFVYSCYL